MSTGAVMLSGEADACRLVAKETRFYQELPRCNTARLRLGLGTSIPKY